MHNLGLIKIDYIRKNGVFFYEQKIYIIYICCVNDFVISVKRCKRC